MSYTDPLKNQALGRTVAAAVESGRSPLIRAVTRLILVSGGLEAMLKRFQRNGFGDVVQSWVAKGRNLPINEKQIEDAIGRKELERLAQDAGVPKQTLAEQLSRALPSIIDRLTPDGVLPHKTLDEDEIRSAGAAWMRASLH